MSNGHNGRNDHENRVSIGCVEGQQPQDISDFGLEIIMSELEAGRTVRSGYTARCQRSGDWENTAATKSRPEEAAVTVVWP